MDVPRQCGLRSRRTRHLGARPSAAIVARVGEDYPQEWIGLCARRGLDTRGVRVLPQTIDLRSFSAYTSRSTRSLDDPVAHFARVGLPFPKALLGYRNTLH